MSALGGVVRSGVGRRRVQTGVVALVVMIAVTAAVLGGSLIVASNQPFDRAFAQQRGAHLAAQFDPQKTTAAGLAASTQATGVSSTAGPFTTAAITPEIGGGRPVQPITVVGREDPGGAVDAVSLTTGRWVTGLGEIVLFSDGREMGAFRARVDDVVRLSDLPGSPELTVVGLARSVSETAGGWVTPEQADALAASGAPKGYQMLYRLAAAKTNAEMATGRAAVEASVSAGALVGTRSWLTTRRASAGDSALFVPFLVAFGVLGVLMAILIVGNVIAGAVSTGTRRIGILKALGFTPNQVVRAYIAQAVIPAAVGALLGVAAGVALTIPVLAQTDKLYGTNDSNVIPWLDISVLLGALVLVALTAWAAAARAGRLRTVDALAVGRTPRPGRGKRAARLTARLRLPRPATLGLAHPFARPLRSATMVAAIAFGAAAVTFAVGLGASLNEAQGSETPGDVVVHPVRQLHGPPPAGGPRPDAGARGPAPLDAAATVATITSHPGSDGWCGVAKSEVTAAGLSGLLEVGAMTGDSCAYGYEMVAGTWFAQPGEIVVSTPFLAATGTRIGDTIVLTGRSADVSVRIVGETFNTENDGMQILADAATVARAEAGLAPMTYNVTVKPGTDITEYAAALTSALAPLSAAAEPVDRDTSESILIINVLTTLLTTMLIAAVALGVVNMVVLDTRERVHDLGVHKALGMTPRQTIAMVVSSVAVTGVLGGLVGMPIGVLVHRLVVTDMGRAAGFNLPPSVMDIYQPVQLALFVLGGLLIAVAGSLLPAGWAAKTRTATALRTE